MILIFPLSQNFLFSFALFFTDQQILSSFHNCLELLKNIYFDRSLKTLVINNINTKEIKYVSIYLI